MIKLFRKRAFVAAMGLLLVALLVWFAGPYLAFADYHPLAPAWVRLALIVLIVLVYVGKHALKRLKAIRAGANLAAAVARPSAPAAGSADVEQLRARFDEAIAHLQQGKRAASLYELPWYAIIGAPGSGKTTALKNSGLHFPLEQKFGREALRGVGGTRNCDWWFTDEAVLLDTAGRYATQDSDQAADAAGWREFLAQLVRHRGRRPLNGILLTLSAADLLTQQPAERALHVGALARRLDELERELKVRLPVYVLVTKSDLVAGFNEYFDDLDHKGRSQVWGVTFPHEKSLAGAAAGEFAGEFARLVQRLNERMPARIDAERDPRRRQAIFAFPQQYGTLAGPLTEYIEGLFAASRPGARPPLLRGVYFTSGTQEGNPIDRILGAMARSLPQDAVAPPPQGAGKAYFIEQLLKDVLFSEAGLAGVNRAAERRGMLLQWGAFAAAGLFAVAGIVALSVSYGRNKAYIAEVSTLAQQLDAAAPRAGESLVEGLPRLDALREMAAVAQRREQGVPLSMRWGLYQGHSLGAQAQDAYLRELNDFLVPRVAEAIRTRLIAYTAEPDKLYEYLKAYLMLGQPERLDVAQLGYMVGLEWRAAYPGQEDVQQRLDTHFRTLLDERRGLRPAPVDEQIVRQARVAIRQASVARLVYSRLKLEYQGRDGAVNLADELGLGADRVLVRKSGRSLDEQVSALYTPAAFDSVKGLGSAALVAQFADDAWVLGDDILTVGDAPRLVGEVLDLYEADYIEVWDSLLRDFSTASFRSVGDLATGLAIIAGPGSPLRSLYELIDRNTYLVKSEEDQAQEAALAQRAQQAVASRLDRLLNSAERGAAQPQAERGAKVTAHFADIHRMVATPAGQARFERVLAQLNDLQRTLQSVGTGVGEVNPLDALAQAGSGDAAKTLRQEAATLPPMLSELVTQVTGRSAQVTLGNARNELLNRYRTEVVARCTEITGGRYPFDANAASDVPLVDFGRLFGAAGVYESFFRDNVEAFVDRSRRPWRWRSGDAGSLGLSDQILRQFELAEQIRATYFLGADPRPQVHFTIVPDEYLDPGTRRARVEIDGKSVDNINGPQRPVPFTWPGPNPGVAAVSFEAKDGGRDSLPFNGPWAMFRLFDAASVQRQSDERFLVGWKKGTREVRVIVEASSVDNPFSRDLLGGFRCGN